MRWKLASNKAIVLYILKFLPRTVDMERSLGFQSKELIVQADLRLGDVDQYPTIDVTIDGADE